jgi:hypothetical protein
VPSPASAQTERTFRLPRLAYLSVLFLLFCVTPLAFARDASQGARAAVGPLTVLLVIPVVAAVFIARTSTTVGARGVTVRALFGTRRLSWEQVRGLSVEGRGVYVVCTDGAVRLPCVRVSDLAAVSRASGGRLPELAEATPKFAPSRRRR